MKKVYQVQINPLNCGWLEVETYEDKSMAESLLEKKRQNNDLDFQFRLIEITVVDKP